MIYLTGNHDEMLRKFSGTKLGDFEIEDKLVLDLDGKKAWFFHGDIFDVSVKNAKWIPGRGWLRFAYPDKSFVKLDFGELWKEEIFPIKKDKTQRKKRSRIYKKL